MSDKKCVGTTASGEKRADGAPRYALETLRWVRSVCRKDLSRVWVLCATRCASAVIAVSFALLMSGAIDAATSQDAAAFGSALALFSAAIICRSRCLASQSGCLAAPRCAWTMHCGPTWRSFSCREDDFPREA